MIVTRLMQLPLILLAIYTITFMLVWIIPGNPLEKPEGRRPPAEIVDAMQARYNLDDPVVFYGDYLSGVTGLDWVLGDRDGPIIDFGPSLRHENWTVNEILAAQLPVSILLGLSAVALACLIGIGAGVLGAVRPGSLLDLGSLLLALVGISLPAFVIGTVLLVVFAVHLGWFPVGGWGEPGHVVLPALALSLPFAAYIARLTRSGMLEELQSDHVRTARAKGMPEYTVVLKHALKNALLPVLSYLGPATAAAMTGSFVVEKVFAVPGVGTHFVDAVLGKDITLILAVVLVYSAMLVLLNLCVDVLYRWIDPRIEPSGTPA
ncbi:MAG: ABC transporter permease [Planctomycetota bacterium]|nr:ABC transporter permease [Planctomycetota bacterium]